MAAGSSTSYQQYRPLSPDFKDSQFFCAPPLHPHFPSCSVCTTVASLWCDPRQRMDLHELYLRVRREDIALLKFLLESYEGIGIVRTIDRKKATVVVLAMPDFIQDVRAVLASLREHMDWYEIPAPAEQDDWLIQHMHHDK